MSRKGPKRKYRIRRTSWRNEAASGADSGLTHLAVNEVAGEVVARFGCCLVEAVGAASVIAALVVVPTHLLLS